MAGPTSKPFLKAFACAGALFVALIAAALVVLGPPGNPGHLAGQLLSTVTIPAIATGFFARRSAKAWSIYRIIGTYVVAFIIVAAAQLASLLASLPHAG